jgi:hypothetical protein
MLRNLQRNSDNQPNTNRRVLKTNSDAVMNFATSASNKESNNPTDTSARNANCNLPRNPLSKNDPYIIQSALSTDILIIGDDDPVLGLAEIAEPQLAVGDEQPQFDWLLPHLDHVVRDESLVVAVHVSLRTRDRRLVH